MGFKAGANPTLHILLETGTVELAPWYPMLQEARRHRVGIEKIRGSVGYAKTILRK